MPLYHTQWGIYICQSAGKKHIDIRNHEKIFPLKISRNSPLEQLTEKKSIIKLTTATTNTLKTPTRVKFVTKNGSSFSTLSPPRNSNLLETPGKPVDYKEALKIDSSEKKSKTSRSESKISIKKIEEKSITISPNLIDERSITKSPNLIIKNEFSNIANFDNTNSRNMDSDLNLQEKKYFHSAHHQTS